MKNKLLYNKNINDEDIKQYLFELKLLPNLEKINELTLIFS